MKKLKRNSFIISIIVTVAVMSLLWFGQFNGFENWSLDMRFKWRGEEKSKAPVVIAKIDDDALQTIGKWPWPRKIHARFLDVCRRAKVSAVVYDVVFYEPDRYEPSNDQALERAIRKNNGVISAYDFKFTEEEIVSQDEKGKTKTEIIPKILKEEPIKQVTRSSKAMGFVNAWPDIDGYLRRGYLSFEFEGTTNYSLNLEAVALMKNESPEELLRKIPSVLTYQWDFPVQELLINWRGSEQVFESHSLTQILDPAIPEDWKIKWLEGKIVIIDSTALGLYDHYPTPFSSSFPGLYYHANLIDNLFTGDYLIPKTGWMTIFLIVLFGILCGFIVPRTHVWAGASLSFSLLAVYWLIGYFLLAKKLVYIELIAPSVSMIANYVTTFFYRFIVEQREKAGIKKAFGVYVNPHVVDQIAKNPDGLKLGGEMREMTVMFSDVAGFTSISEKLSPQELVQLLNLYLTAMTDTIMKYDGTVDKYEGDAIMAFWGAPLVQPDHAKKACFAVLENRQKLAELNAELEKKGMNKLSARCGLNTGPMNVGNMGSSQKFNYTVMGDAVNLASRLEGANKQYNTYLMISETTYEKVKDAVEVRELDLLRVKGKKIPIKVYELVSKKDELTDHQKRGFEVYHEALTLYRKRHFKEALKKFQQVKEFLPEDDGPTGTYIGRTQDYIEKPPEKEWDGVYVMTTK